MAVALKLLALLAKQRRCIRTKCANEREGERERGRERAGDTFTVDGKTCVCVCVCVFAGGGVKSARVCV